MTVAKFKKQTDREQLLRDMMRLNEDRMIHSLAEDLIPPDWHTLTWDLETCPKKEKITLYLDQPVARFFRAMGTGYQMRINRLLGSYMRLQIHQYFELEKQLEDRTGIEGEVE